MMEHARAKKENWPNRNGERDKFGLVKQKCKRGCKCMQLNIDTRRKILEK